MEKRIKIGIVTIISRNLGNRLQNYALYWYLKNMGYDVKTIPIKKRTIKNYIKTLGKNVLSPFVNKYKDVVWENFDKNIRWDNRIISESGSLLDKEYDFFVAGSDQIWNPLFACNSEREFLTFADPQKRVAYAASIGLSELPNKYVEEFDNYWKSFKAISVREDDASKIIKNVSKIDVPVVIDPTMLLGINEWDRIAKKSRVKINKPYILKYFLGIRNKEYDEYIERLAKEKNAFVFDLHKNSKLDVRIGPAEFVDLIKNSVMMCTDSFHGTVFSILYHKNFLVFERPDEEGYGKMTSRIDTLLGKFALEDRRIVNLNTKNKISDIDYIFIDKEIEKERMKSRKYLQDNLKQY